MLKFQDNGLKEAKAQAEALLASYEEFRLFERETALLQEQVKARGEPQTAEDRERFLADMRELYAKSFHFLSTTAVGVIPDAKRHQLLAEGHAKLADLEATYAKLTGKPAGVEERKLGYWQYPHLWPVLALIVGLVVIAAKFGGAA